MTNKQDVIKNLIKYLSDVYNDEKIEALSQSFFISNKEGFSQLAKSAI